MDFLKGRLNVHAPGKGENGSDYVSMFPDFQIEAGSTPSGGYLSLSMFNAKDGNKTPVSELNNVLSADSRSVKISFYDLPSLYMLKTSLETAILIAEKNKREAALKSASN